MKRSSFVADLAVLLIGMLFLAVGAFAQTVPGSAVLTWTNPTTSTDGLPLTGANALTGIEVHWATAPIADADLTRAPQLTLGGTVATTTQTIQVANGSTLYFRLRAVRGTDKSAYSAQVSKAIVLSTVPGMPTGVTLSLTITPTPP
jgi:hypothetical protein